MNSTELKLSYDICAPQNGLPVIIVAAGSSSRMGGQNKQFLELGGIPVIARTLLAFENSDVIKNIILVVRAEDVFSLQMLAEKYGISKLSDIVCGAGSRQESVLKGFARLSKEETAVLIHDGARPLVTKEIISSVAAALENHSAVTCAVKVKDTIKEIDKDGKVTKTLDRENLVAVQTPQGVNAEDYLAAIEKLGDIKTFTDDTASMEAAGYDVFTVEGSYKNIKITTPEDIPAAESFLE